MSGIEWLILILIMVGSMIFLWWWLHPGPAGHIWYDQMMRDLYKK